MIQRANRYLDTLSYWKKTLLLTVVASSLKIIAFAVLLLAMLISDEADTIIKSEHNSESMSFMWFFTLLVIAPLLETLISQMLVIRLCLRSGYLRKHPLLIILISTVLFALLHAVTTMPLAFLAGIVLAYNYYYHIVKSENKKAYWSTVFIHFCVNLIAVSAMLYEQSL